MNFFCFSGEISESERLMLNCFKEKELNDIEKKWIETHDIRTKVFKRDSLDNILEQFPILKTTPGLDLVRI